MVWPVITARRRTACGATAPGGLPRMSLIPPPRHMRMGYGNPSNMPLPIVHGRPAGERRQVALVGAAAWAGVLRTAVGYSTKVVELQPCVVHAAAKFPLLPRRIARGAHYEA